MGTPDTFIPGLEQYCDRWCERCPLKARCATFARPLSRGGRPGASPDEAHAWQELQSALEATLELLQQATSSADARARRWAAPARDEHRGAPAHPVIAAAYGYTRLVTAWLDAERGWLHDKRLAIRRQLHASADPAAAIAAAEALCDALDVIAWDHTLIPAVLSRAVGGRGAPQPYESPQGLAKLALVSIDRSVSAWLRVRAARSGQPETVIPVLAQLDRLRRMVEGEFRGARAFTRPGFDACYH